MPFLQHSAPPSPHTDTMATPAQAAFARYASLLTPEELSHSSKLLADVNINKHDLLASIPRTPSYQPLAVLSALLAAVPGPWPVLELQQTHTEFWKLLPEEAKSGKASPQGQQLIDNALLQCKRAYSSLLDMYHAESSATAIIDPEAGRSLTHKDLTRLVSNFGLPLQVATGGPKPVVAISLPNGALLALTVLSVATYYTAAPIAHGSGVGAEQFRTDVLQSKSNLVLASSADVERLSLRDMWLQDAGIQVILVSLTSSMHLALSGLNGEPVLRLTSQPTPNSADDTAIMLFTSGTSGTKKLVPLTIHSMVCGAAMVVDSWGLSPSMRCLNQMPLNHVGGLIRNLFSPVMSGGSVICCSAFDANGFWDIVEDHAPTWYYASPSMHQGILEIGADRPESIAKSQIKLVCNAAGGLLPSLAHQICNTFSNADHQTTVLPSYGMTECMPISTPPLNYKLDRTGTSGVSVGPELSIQDGNGSPMATGTVGRISVRGSPLFGGYLKAGNVIDKSCFSENGWFDTGDMGYLDADGYLYITGRSKEVINRGGELISPFEVEEAVIAAAATPGSRTHGRISKALAFSVTHNVLQEVVGIAVVTPKGSQRACLRGIQESIKSVLNSVKVPVLVVYMDGGLPVQNNKVLRIRLADRLALPEIGDETSHAQRHYEAVSPPINTPLSQSIDCQQVEVTHDDLNKVCANVMHEELDFHVRLDASDFYPELLLAPKSHQSSPAMLTTPDAEHFLQQLGETLPGYSTPFKIIQLGQVFPRNADGRVDLETVNKLLGASQSAGGDVDMSNTEKTVASLLSQILSIPIGEVSKDSDFFELGGSSMAAGQLLSKLRKEFQLRLAIDVLFTARRVSALSALIDDRLGAENVSTGNEEKVLDTLLPGCEKTCSSSNPFLMFLQLIPMGLLYPMKRAMTWTIFIYFMTVTQNWVTNMSIPGRLLDLVISMTIARLATRTIAPVLAIACKWLLIGRYQEGIYPMWGSYHTRWWFTQKVIAICGIGNFGMFNFTRVLYYRAMGAKIGKNVTMAKGATLGEYDLITIEANVTLERCNVRPFAAERNTSMYLGRIFIGANASVGLQSIVAAGTSIPANACLGPNSSSWEIADADESNRDLAASKIPAPHWALAIFVGLPSKALVAFAGALPWLGCLVALVAHQPNTGVIDQLREVIIWFANPKRVAIHYAALAANSALGPACLFLAVYIIKKVFDVCCGALKPSHVSERSQMTQLRMTLLQSLMPASTFHKLTELFGSHYEATSIFARMMGAKVGQRVYWPGTGPSTQDFQLLDIGNDVVFGSRSHLVTSDGTGSDYVRIKNGAMVADRVVLLPGVELGDKTVMGSGALSKRNTHYAPGSTWVGAKKGEAVCLLSEAPAPSQGSAPGHRAVLYQAGKLNEKYISNNSSSATLVKPLGSGASSINATERGYYTTSGYSTPATNSPGHGTPRYIGESRPSSMDKAETKKMVSARILSFKRSDSEKAADVAEQAAAIESSSPFGRAFYHGLASYRVWGQFTIFCYSTFIAVFTAVWWNAGSISAVQVLGHIMSHRSFLYRYWLSGYVWFRPLSLWLTFTAIIVAIMAVQSMLVLAGLIAAKWVLMGRRKPGNYDWDKSSYCQVSHTHTLFYIDLVLT